MLRIGDIGLRASSKLASLGLRAICGLLFFESASWPTRLPSRRDQYGGSDPQKGSVYRAPLCAPVNARRCRTSGQKRGVAPSTNTPSRAARRRAGRGEDARGAARQALSQRRRGIRANPLPLRIPG